MKEFNPYIVEYTCDGSEPQTLQIYAADPGMAFLKVAKRFPNAKIVGGYRWGYLAGHWVRISYNPPSAVRVEPLPAADAEEQVFGFFDQCIGGRPPIIATGERN